MAMLNIGSKSLGKLLKYANVSNKQVACLSGVPAPIRKHESFLNQVHKNKMICNLI